MPAKALFIEPPPESLLAKTLDHLQADRFCQRAALNFMMQLTGEHTEWRAATNARAQ